MGHHRALSTSATFTSGARRPLGAHCDPRERPGYGWWWLRGGSWYFYPTPDLSVSGYLRTGRSGFRPTPWSARRPAAGPPPRGNWYYAIRPAATIPTCPACPKWMARCAPRTSVRKQRVKRKIPDRFQCDHNPCAARAARQSAAGGVNHPTHHLKIAPVDARTRRRGRPPRNLAESRGAEFQTGAC